MAQKLDFTLPYNSLIQYVPQNLRNPVIKGLLDNLFDRFMTHDESVPLYGYIGRKPSASDDRAPLIPQATVERDINAIVPVINFKLGADTHAFTIQDVINKARAIGVSSTGLQWLYSQSNNYLPPIDIDKFANFFNYFWVARAVTAKPNLSWNPENLPEYYTIAKPKASDKTKLNVLVATTESIIRTGTGFNDQSFTITFTSPLTFTITADKSLGDYRTVDTGDAMWPAGYTVTLAPATQEQVYEDTITFNVTNGTTTANLVTFKIAREPIYNSSGSWVGNENFEAGDKFFVDTNFLSLNYNVVFNGSPGVKGKIKSVKSYDTYQMIDGVRLSAGQRILIKDNSSIENGIYIVGPQSWSRAADYDGTLITPNAQVWVSSGTTNGGKLFTSGVGNTWSAGVTTVSNTNDWQEGNFWATSEEVTALGLTRSDVIQAVRPIIEYNASVQLNSYVTNGTPTDTGVGFFKQTKTEFNQLPLFDLYRYDGTHSGLVSSIFYYVEDLTAELDLDLQKRIKLSSTDSEDFVFNHGLVDESNNLLFYKSNDALKTIWHAGYTDVAVVDKTFVGKIKGTVTQLIPTTIAVPQTWAVIAISPTTFSVTGSSSGLLSTTLTVGVPFSNPEFTLTITNGTIPFVVGEGFSFSIDAGPTATTPIFTGQVKGQLTNVVATPTVQQQIWTIQAVTPTRFTVVGSKTKSLPPPYNTLTVGVPYSNEDFSCLITAGDLPFNVDDAFIFRIGNLETPRYVYRDAAGLIYDLYGGQATDTANVGAYQVPRPFINNPYNDARDEVLEGTLYAHFRGILQNQFEDTPIDYAFGGSVKNWSEQQTLLASLLIQRDLTPISMIDLAQRQYETGLNSINDIYKQTVLQYFTTVGVVDPDGTAIQQQRLNVLLDEILKQRAHDNDVRTVLYDSTSAVTGIPITLPQLGILPRVKPGIEYDQLLGRVLITHHDGHNSIPQVDNLEFRRALLNNSADIKVLRSDKTKTPAVGSFTAAEPIKPYKGELWIRPNGAESTMLAFDVDYDATPPSGVIALNATWYNRATNVLSKWDGIQWVAQPSHSQQWRVVDLADTLNQLTLLVEQRLYDGINPNARKVDFSSLLNNLLFKDQLKRELFTFSANNGLVPLGSDYNAADAFSWNYSQAALASFAPITGTAVPARWHKALRAHQSTVANVIPTDRPDLEPWKLVGFETFEAWWASLDSSQQLSYTPYKSYNDLSTMINGGTVRAVSTVTGVTPQLGLQVIDGVALSIGDRVLLVNEIAPENNGVFVVGVGAWARAPVVLTKDTYFRTTSGVANQDTVWAITAAVPTIGVSPISIQQVRFWSDQLWVDIKAARPTLKLSVDTHRDRLLAPYVNPTVAQAVNALTTSLPPGAANGYAFGDGGPVETVWQSSLDYGYALARALFRHDPLMFLGFCWGFNWVKVDGILYDGYDINTPGHKRFRLHGDLNSQITRNVAGMISGSGPATIVYDAYEVTGSNRYQNFSVRNSAGIAVGYAREGVQTTVGGLTINIQDNGQPFRIGDKFVVDAAGAVTFVSAVNHTYLGFGQVFTNALRDATIDTVDSYAIDAFRGWDINMGHRAGGLVVTDDLKVSTETDTLSPSSYNLLFKKNPLARDLWVQALRITVSQFGSSTTNPDTTVSPKSDGADWVFLIEGYNPRYLNIEYYNLMPTGTFQTFNVLDQTATKTVWKEFTQHTSTTNTFLPLTITGIQNVVNFLFGYSKFLEDQGWLFNHDNTKNVDAETGRARTYQLEVEKFIDRCYRGIQLGQGHIVNPFMEQIWVRQDTGILAEFRDTALFDITGHAGVFDIAGTKFTTADLYAIRGNLISQFSATAPMYSAHAQLDEFEHLFLFNNYVEDSIQNGLLYHPFSGARTVTYKFNGRRQAASTFRPEFGGHYLVGNEVRQNLQGSTDNIANFYDANRSFETEKTTRHALALLGFNTKGYFDDLDISDKSQFNFWRGLIQSKGTNLSIDAYLNNNRFEDAKIDEYWAYKIATFGDSRQHSYPELRLNVDDTLQQFTQLQFDATTPLANFTQINKFDENRWFGIDDLDHDASFRAEVVGTFYLTTAVARTNYTLPFVADKLVLTNATQLNATTITAINNGLVTVVGYGPATPRYNPVKLFNYVDNELVEEIPLWHPAHGQHTPTALESINIISTQNPAKYNSSTQVVNNNRYDPLRPWGSNEIGRVWFDTRNLAYIPYYDETIFSNRSERLSRWGALADFATIDVYEWVQSSVPPNQYNALAAQQGGDADLDPTTKAVGEVALQETYSRNRIWHSRPIAWSYSTVPTNTEWGGSPPFGIANFDATLSFVDDVVSIDYDTELRSFADIGISPGMRIGAWDQISVPPKPVSEYIISDNFTKLIVGAPANVSNYFQVDVETTEYTSARGQLLFFEQPVEVVQQATTDGELIDAWDVSFPLKIWQVDQQVSEVVILNSGVSTDAANPYVSSTLEDPFSIAVVEPPPTTTFTYFDINYKNLASPATTKVAYGYVSGGTSIPYTADITAFGTTKTITLFGRANYYFTTVVAELNTQLAQQGLPLTAELILDSASTEKFAKIRLTATTPGQANISIVDGSTSPSKLFAGMADPSRAGWNNVDFLGMTTTQSPSTPTELSQAKFGALAGQVFSFFAPSVGLTIRVTATQSGIYLADQFMKVIAAALSNRLGIRDAVTVIAVVPNNTSIVPHPEQLSNDLQNPINIGIGSNLGIGWRAWTVPSQAQLTADGRYPVSSWKPYVGNYEPIAGNYAELQDAIAYAKNPLTLNDGTVIERYATTWTDWVTLNHDIAEAIPTISKVLWSVRPIAWPTFPPINWSSAPKLYFENNGSVSLEFGTPSEAGIIAGRHLGAWDLTRSVPLGEYIVEGQPFRNVLRNGTVVPTGGFQSSAASNFYPATAVSIINTAQNSIIGALTFEGITTTTQVGNAWNNDVKLKITAASGETETVLINSAIGTSSDSGNAGQPYIPPTPYIPATPATPYIPAVPAGPPVLITPATARSATARINFSTPVNIHTQTGLQAGTTYRAKIHLDNVTWNVVVVPTSEMTFGQLLTQVNSQLPQGDAGSGISIRTLDFTSDGNLIITSTSRGTNSYAWTVPQTNSPELFEALNYFDGFGQPQAGQPGTQAVWGPGTPAIPAVPASPGTPAIPASPGQPYIPPTPSIHGATVTVTDGQIVTIPFVTFGLEVKLRISVPSGGSVSYPATAFQQAIVTALGTPNTIVLKNAIAVTEITPNQPSSNPVSSWRAWYVPTQDEVTHYSFWPYFGDFSSTTSETVEADATVYAQNPITLSDGTVVERYQTIGVDWNSLIDTVPFTFAENIDANRASVYVNGIAQLKDAFTINGKSLSVANVEKGSKVTVIIRKYEPTAEELAFDPVVKDDLSFQRQYKQDYEYVALPVRDSEGALSSSIYYFWVKNKSVNAVGKKLSIQSIAQELRDGPANFLTFQNLIGAGTSTDPYRYDAITISGLSYIVAKDNAFKLRFTRNFTLRDDPQELDLKDNHTEWSLIRSGQRVRIPEALWNKLTDSLAGENIAGSPVPALRRVLYDERNSARTRFGFDPEQTLAPRELLISSVTHTIVNTKLINKSVPASVDGTYPADFIEVLDFNQSDDWFATAAKTRQTMTTIWNGAKPAQVNEIFFAALNDILANNYELSDVFKTSRLSAYSIKAIATAPITPTYE